MTDSITRADALGSVPRARLGALCHLVRWTALVWLAWSLGQIIVNWSDGARIARGYGRHLNVDLGGLPSISYAAAFAVMLLVWATAAAVGVFVWRLFGHYLRGDIFSASAAVELQRLGWAGVVAVCADIAARPLILMLLTLHLDGGRPFGIWGQPNDLLHVIMALFVVVLAYVFRAGAAVAEDHRQFV